MAGMSPDAEGLPEARYVVLRPVDLTLQVGTRLVGTVTDSLENADGFRYRQVRHDSLHFVNPDKCLWDFADLTEGDKAGVLRFVETWGVSTTWEALDGSRSLSSNLFQSWFVRAHRVRAILHALALTATGDLVDEETLHELSALLVYDEWKVQRHFGDPLLGRFTAESPEVRHQRLRDERAATWQRLRAAGSGIAIQRQMLVLVLYNFFLGLQVSPSWDEGGRRLTTQAEGVEDIIGATLQSLFLSQSIDLFVCSTCGKTYPFESIGSERRPRRGVSRFCSHECRAEGKRKVNLESWHRNKTRWLRKGQQK